MVTQRVAPIRPDASPYHGGKAALDELLARRDGSPHAVEQAEALLDDDDDAAPLGLAVNTRNYQALLDSLARRRRAGSGASSVSSGGASPAYRRQTLAMGTVYQQHVDNQLESDAALRDEKLAQTVGAEQVEEEGEEEEEEEEEVQDRTVVGLPVDTRNYEAIVSGSRPIRSDPGTFNLLNRRATVATMPQMPIPPRVKEAEEPQQTQAVAVPVEGDVGDDDAVMGLPISTGNYVAYLAGEQGSGLKQAGHRNRGYSNLASEKEPRVSDPYLSSSRRGKSPPDSFTTAPSNNNNNSSSNDDPRPSCFDNRRASNAAFVPHAGWVFIRHGAFKTWKRYYAVLSGTEFKYSKGVGQSPKGFGLLSAVKRMEDLRYGLSLEFGDGGTLQIRCPGENDYDQWLEFMEKTVERNQTINTQSKTSYTLTASEQHEGYLFKQEKNKAWKRCFFVVRIDGYIECRDHEHGAADRKYSGYIKAVSFADCHANGLAIQLSTDASMVCYADSYDEQMLWYGAITAAASANGKTAQPKTSVKSCYVQTALSNHAGWLYKQAGLFKGWKRLYFTLHGVELAYAKDTNSETVLCDKAHTVEEWEGHANGLLIRLMSGRVWKIHAESYETAKRWRSVISSACRHAETFNLKKYLNSRRRKKLRPVFGGWLTEVSKGSRLRRFYVMDGSTLGVANDVDNQLERLGTVVDVGSTRDLECGMVFTLANGNKLKVNCDSLADSRCWYECLNFSFRQ
ncbi:Pleckstrin homology-like domain [Phytophthora cinnamomi]|uniref:Pleckstrin homology-like domain n=1 Tax=Phytophthora cinnamomi TaxID=4785 RepID=UPI00355A1A3F|nr:Pleckstrin homology-like domain [Phytophthora cinnamomi]